jgi:hypothetical protein
LIKGGGITGPMTVFTDTPVAIHLKDATRNNIKKFKLERECATHLMILPLMLTCSKATNRIIVTVIVLSS